MKCANAARFFSPPERRWPEGPDEGGKLSVYLCRRPLSPHPRPSPPNGEKKQAASARPHSNLTACVLPGQQRHCRHGIEERARHTAEQQLPPAGMAVSAHDQKVDAVVGQLVFDRGLR